MCLWHVVLFPYVRYFPDLSMQCWSRRIISKHALVWDGRPVWPVWVFVQLEGYFSWILSSHPWLQGKPSQSTGSPGSPGSPACLLKNCSCEACPFPPALAVVVSPDLKDVVDKMEGSSGPTKFLGLLKALQKVKVHQETWGHHQKPIGCAGTPLCRRWGFHYS